MTARKANTIRIYRLDRQRHLVGPLIDQQQQFGVRIFKYFLTTAPKSFHFDGGEVMHASILPAIYPRPLSASFEVMPGILRT